MKFHPNISILNSLIRITCGFTLLTWSMTKFSKKPWRQSYLLIALLSAMKIGEGILHYCPVVDAMNQYKSKESDYDSPINPT